MRKWIVAISLLCLGLQASAQSARLKKADDYFAQGELSASIPLYHKVLEREDVPQAKINLAEAYFGIGDYSSAANWYALVMGMEQLRPEHRLRYGLALLWSGDCEAAERWFAEYLKLKPYDHRKPQLLRACEEQQALAQKQQGLVKVEGLSFNSAVNDLAPAFFRDGIVFTSDQRQGPDGRLYAGLYYAGRLPGDSLAFEAPVPFSIDADGGYQEGTATFNAAQDEVFYTRARKTVANRAQGQGWMLEIVSGRLLPQGNWSALQALPFSSNEYAIAHPALSSDGQRLFFSSDRPGGFGGKDLYLSVRLADGWSPPVNLGPEINTEGDEMYPFLNDDGTLYFASNGHFGLGGQDVFSAREGEDGLWQRPENMGAPINTAADDFGLIFSSAEQVGYFTSNREGGAGGDDIYYFEHSGRLTVIDLLDLSSGMPIPGAHLVNAQAKDTLKASQDGRIALRLSKCTSLTGFAEGYMPKAIEACPDELPPGKDTLFVAMALKADLPVMLSGVVFDRATGRPLEGAGIKLKGAGCEPPSPVSSSAQGRFAVALQPSCCYELRVHLAGYELAETPHEVCADAEPGEQFVNLFLQPDQMGSTRPRDTGISRPTVREEVFSGFERSTPSRYDSAGTVAFRLKVYYDVGRSSVQSGSVGELFRLRDLLLQNPDIKVEISSHTDANGNREENLRLSQKRADAIVRYLTDQGISRSRLQARGYGETRLLNDCTKGVPCSELQHQENRRTELRLIE